MKLVLPLPPNRANERKHWRARQREKKEYWAALDALRVTRRIPRPPEAAPERARIRVTLYVHNIMDDDNAMARLKYAIDWLVAWQYLPGDRRDVLAWAGLPDQHIDRKNPRVEIEIEDIQREAA